MAAVAEARRTESTLALPHYGDLLETIVSKVAMADLVSAYDVSRAWRQAVVASSLRRFPRVKPWLILRLRHASVAYDPHSSSWVPLPLSLPFRLPSPGAQLYLLPIHSSHPHLLFALSPPSNLSIADPLAATWSHLPLPRVVRYDPVVALVGSIAVVAEGARNLEGVARGAVEAFDLNCTRRQWSRCQPVPSNLGTSSTCLSVATSDIAMYVINKNSGLFASFEPESGKWSRTFDLRPDPTIRLSAIGFSGTRLVLAGLSGQLMSLTLWEVDPDQNPECSNYKEIGRMPEDMVKTMVREGSELMSTIGFSVVGDYAYLYNPAHFDGGFFYEIGERKWKSIGRPKELDDDPASQIVYGSSKVGLDDLRKAFRTR